MNAFVIDVNVLIVANARETQQASPECMLECVKALEMVQQNVLVLDDLGLVFEAYQNYNNFSGQPRPGDAFFKWVHNNQYASSSIERVLVTPFGFSFFGIPEALKNFDSADHIWLAVAQASLHSPTILNATDTDWFEWQSELETHGFLLRFVCPELMRVRRG